MKRAIALRHDEYGGLDLVGDWLAARGIDALTIDPPKGDLSRHADAAREADLLIVLGGSMGVYERAAHPWIDDEIALVAARLNAKGPTLGLCFGAQLMAAALGARVYQGPAPEIGWPALKLTEAGRASPLAPLDGVGVMQWHGDTFDLPAGATHLAQSAAYAHQAFSAGPHALALQFHLELTEKGFEGWMAHPEDEGGMLARSGCSEAALRAETARAAPKARAPAFAALDAWRARL